MSARNDVGPRSRPGELGIVCLLARRPSERRFVSGQSCVGCLEWRAWKRSLSSACFWLSISWCSRASRGSRASPERPGPLPRRGTRRAAERTPRSESGPRCPSSNTPAENAGRSLKSSQWEGTQCRPFARSVVQNVSNKSSPRLPPSVVARNPRPLPAGPPAAVDGSASEAGRSPLADIHFDRMSGPAPSQPARLFNLRQRKP